MVAFALDFDGRVIHLGSALRYRRVTLGFRV